MAICRAAKQKKRPIIGLFLIHPSKVGIIYTLACQLALLEGDNLVIAHPID